MVESAARATAVALALATTAAAMALATTVEAQVMAAAWMEGTGTRTMPRARAWVRIGSRTSFFRLFFAKG